MFLRVLVEGNFVLVQDICPSLAHKMEKKDLKDIESNNI